MYLSQCMIVLCDKCITSALPQQAAKTTIAWRCSPELLEALAARVKVVVVQEAVLGQQRGARQLRQHVTALVVEDVGAELQRVVRLQRHEAVHVLQAQRLLVTDVGQQVRQPRTDAHAAAVNSKTTS